MKKDLYFKSIFTFLITLLCHVGFGQTNPSTFDLSSNDYSFNGFQVGTITEYPPSMIGWGFNTEPNNNFVGVPTKDVALSNSSASATSGNIKNEIGNGISILNSGSNNIGAIAVSVNTLGRENVKVSWSVQDITSTSTRQNGIVLQYRIGKSGNFTTIETSRFLSNNSGLKDKINFEEILPLDINNQQELQLRWLYYFNTGSGPRDRLRIDDILITSEAIQLTAPILTTPQTITGTYGVLINQTITGEHIIPSTNWFITGTKPTGVDFANGVFNGSPNEIGLFTSSVRAKNGNLESDEITVNFDISKADQKFPDYENLTKRINDPNVTLPSKTKHSTNTTLEANDIIYSSSNLSVVEIENGYDLKFVGEGTATITATSANTNPNYATITTELFNVTVSKIDQTVNLQDIYNLIVDEEIQLPVNSEQGLPLNYNLSNNNGVVEIIGNQLKALVAGQITLVVSNGGNGIYKEFSKEIVINVSLHDVNDLMISQIYSAGGGSEATYKNDFVELYNSSDVTIPLFGLHLQYASSNGLFNVSSNTNYDLTLSFKENDYIEPKSFYLIKLGGGSTGSDLNYFENTANINIATTDGKLALTKRLLDNHTGQDRSDIIDLVGYGNANIYEGSGKANSPTNTKSIRRKNNGTQDTNDNKNDFELIDVNPYVNISVWENRNWFKGVLPNENRNAVLLSDLLNTTTFTAKNVLVYKNVTVPSGVVITSEESLKIKEGFTITFNEGAYLLQNNPNAVNKGNATFKRNATFFRYDSKFWSSPVEEQSISGFMPNPSGIYTYNTANRNWDNTTDTNFLSAKGYIFQAGSDYPFYGSGVQILFDGSFTGVPHNGNYSVPVSYTGLGDNGVGNPYGSPISASAFLNENDHVTRLYFWGEESHYIPGTNPPIYQGQRWSALNQTGHNDGPTELIGVGVGFIARVDGSDDIVFNNSMRTINTVGVDIFNRTSTEKDRFWLSLNLNNNKENQILIGYVEGATNGIDEKYDAKNLSNNNSFILSHSNANAMIIEGRQYPLDVNDQIPLYFRASELGDYTIKLENKEGIFNSQPIYLIDNELNLSINLNEETEYTFNSEIGNFTDRFEIRYQPKEALSSTDLDESLDLIVYKNEKLNKVTSKENIIGYKVYDFSGRLISDEKVNQLKDFTLTNQNKGTYIVKFTLENGRVISKKVIF